MGNNKFETEKVYVLAGAEEKFSASLLCEKIKAKAK